MDCGGEMPISACTVERQRRLEIRKKRQELLRLGQDIPPELMEAIQDASTSSSLADALEEL